MKIDKAIEIQTRRAKILQFHPKPDELDATKLGIEALKRVKEERTGYESYAPDLLPGETYEFSDRFQNKRNKTGGNT